MSLLEFVRSFLRRGRIVLSPEQSQVGERLEALKEREQILNSHAAELARSALRLKRR